MTRCLDCGAQRVDNQCPECGLTPAAAEFVFRRRLLRQTAIFLLGSLLFPYLSQIYPPLDLDAMLVLFGLVFFTGLALAANRSVVPFLAALMPATFTDWPFFSSPTQAKPWSSSASCSITTLANTARSF